MVKGAHTRAEFMPLSGTRGLCVAAIARAHRDDFGEVSTNSDDADVRRNPLFESDAILLYGARFDPIRPLTAAQVQRQPPANFL